MKDQELTKEERALDAFAEMIFGKGRTHAISTNTCVYCRQPATEFRDDISKKEYQISALCQTCQDVAFAPPEDKDE